MPIETLLLVDRREPDPLGDLDRDLLLAAGQQHGELLAAVAGQHVVGADGRRHARRRAAQQRVAGGVPVAVVVVLEVVRSMSATYSGRVRLRSAPASN